MYVFEGVGTYNIIFVGDGTKTKNLQFLLHLSNYFYKAIVFRHIIMHKKI